MLTEGVSESSKLGPLLFNIIVNDLFIEKCHLYNYANEISQDSSSENLSDMLHDWRHDGSNAVE